MRASKVAALRLLQHFSCSADPLWAAALWIRRLQMGELRKELKPVAVFASLAVEAVADVVRVVFGAAMMALLKVLVFSSAAELEVAAASNSRATLQAAARLSVYETDPFANKLAPMQKGIELRKVQVALSALATYTLGDCGAGAVRQRRGSCFQYFYD